MVKGWIAGLAALVLGCGAHEAVQSAQPTQPTQPTVETIVISNETMERYYAKKHKRAEELYSVGVRLYEAKSYPFAINYFSQALAKNRDLNKAIDKMAESYLCLEEYDAAEAYAEIAVDREPDNDYFKATLKMIQDEKERKRKEMQASNII